MHTISQSQPLKKKGVNKLVLGFAAVVASAIVGTTGFVAATSQNNSDKPSKQHCAAAGFKNYGQCVKEWAKGKNRPGGGYGNINIGVDLDIKGNNNIVQIIINIIRP